MFLFLIFVDTPSQLAEVIILRTELKLFQVYLYEKFVITYKQKQKNKKTKAKQNLKHKKKN